MEEDDSISAIHLGIKLEANDTLIDRDSSGNDASPTKVSYYSSMYLKTDVKVESIEEPSPEEHQTDASVQPTVEGGEEDAVENSYVNVQEFLDVIIEDSETNGNLKDKKVIINRPLNPVTKNAYEKTDHQCVQCLQIFKSIFLLREHVLTHKVSTIKHINCNKCDFKCVKTEMLEKHKLLHDVSRPFQCDICSYRFTNKVGLQVHMKVHTTEKCYPCDLCDYKTSKYFDLRAHLKIHVEDLLLKCEYCEYKCKYKHLMKRHMRTHTSENPYKCDLCNYRSNFSCNLKNHMRTHTGECFKCELCEYRGVRKAQLMTHMRTHTGERPFKCQYCDYRCNRNGDLKIHTRIHTGEKPYKCDYCEYKTSDRGSLRYHRRRHESKLM